jgi:hypothetical protein
VIWMYLLARFALVIGELLLILFNTFLITGFGITEADYPPPWYNAYLAEFVATFWA